MSHGLILFKSSYFELRDVSVTLICFSYLATGLPHRLFRKAKPMDALMFLRQDLKSVLGMLEVLDQAPSGSGAEISALETMVTNLVIAESQHEAIEEQFFWPAVRDALEDGDALADEAISAGK
jgi:hypothetical protein